MIIVLRLVQPKNAPEPITSTLAGIVISSNEVHPLKPSILVNPFAKVISFRFIHPSNA